MTFPWKYCIHVYDDPGNTRQNTLATKCGTQRRIRFMATPLKTFQESFLFRLIFNVSPLCFELIHLSVQFCTYIAVKQHCMPYAGFLRIPKFK